MCAALLGSLRALAGDSFYSTDEWRTIMQYYKSIRNKGGGGLQGEEGEEGQMSWRGKVGIWWKRGQIDLGGLRAVIRNALFRIR